MRRVENEMFSKRVIHYYENVAHRSKKNTVQHFAGEGNHRKTIYRIIERYQETGDASYKNLPGRPAVKSSPKTVKKVETTFRKDPNISVRVAAKKLGLDRSTLSRIKVHKLGITARTKKNAPKYIKDQEERAKTGLRKIYKKILQKVLITDEETYLTQNSSQLPGRKFIHARDHNEVEYEHRFHTLTKFPKKYLVWQALDEYGNVSEPYISNMTMTSEIYLKECIKSRLIPFIKKHHKMEDILFWPDLASSHYGIIVTDFLTAQNINFVQKVDNPPNVPQARGIEKFWAVCKQRLSGRRREPKNLHGFKLVWNKISKTVAEEMGISIMGHASKWIRGIGYKGVRRAMCDLTNH